MYRSPLPPVETMLNNDVPPEEIDRECDKLRENYRLYLMDEADINDFPYIQQLVLWGSAVFHVVELLDLIHELVDLGASVTVTDRMSLTPLHGVASVRVAKLLLSLGADINAMTKDGVTPLDCAAQMNHRAVARFLLKNGGKFSYIKYPEIFNLD